MPTATETAIGGAILAGALVGGLLASDVLDASDAVETEPVPVVQPAAPEAGVKAGLRYGVIPADACTPEIIRELCASRPGSELTTTCASQRRSLDGKYMIVKWRGDPPKSVANILVPEKAWSKAAAASNDIAWQFGAIDKALDVDEWRREEMPPESGLLYTPAPSEWPYWRDHLPAMSGYANYDFQAHPMPDQEWGAPGSRVFVYDGVELSEPAGDEAPWQDVDPPKGMF
jgi:hypothetical protein